ncbi:MAG: nucleoside-diphosphate sugar epimerase/dehydratase [Mariprofundaceae bacterium]
MHDSGLKLIRSSRAAFVHDALWVPLALLLAYWVRFNLGHIPPVFLHGYAWMLAVALPVQLLAFRYFGLYRGIWRFASMPDLVRILKAVAVGGVCSVLAVFLLQRLEGVPRSVLLLYPLFLCLGLAAPRLLYRWFKDHHFDLAGSKGRSAIIVGAGRAGELLLRDLIKSKDYAPVGFVDDDATKQGREIHGVRVLGGTADLAELAQQLSVDVVLLAMPAVDHKVVQKIVRSCREADVPCRTLPSLAELAGGTVEVSKLREVRIGDILGRDPVVLDDAGLLAMLRDKRVLVTGAGGSIGSELCRQVMRYQPDRLVLLDHAEYNLYRIDHELRARHADADIISLLGDVRDEARMRGVFGDHRPHIVLHAAAYKHVPLVEHNPVEGIKTNVLGTRLVADLVVEYGAETFVFVSTDKAVNPTNLMGATKRAAEIYCQNLNGRVDTRFITTRFGNVLGSAGSVVPLFREQIAAGGPITVTHPDITRYFMTIPEACQLILQAGSMGKGGEIFVLEMGEPIKIVDLAEQMIHLSGLEPGKDIEINFIGLRPGEKMHEELFYGSEALFDTEHPKIMLAAAQMVDREAIQEQFSQMKRDCSTKLDQNAIRALKALIPEYAISRDS